jgi:hypothetical protein
LFASIGKAFKKSDIFNPHMYKTMCEQYCDAKVLTSENLFNWSARFENMMKAIPQISQVHHFAFANSYANVCMIQSFSLTFLVRIILSKVLK